MLTDKLGELVFVDLCGPLTGEVHRGGLGHADGIAQLHFADVGKIGGNDILRDITGHVGCGAIDLGRILAGERSAAMPPTTAVGVDDDLASREAAIALRASDLELAGGVHMDRDVIVPPFAEHRFKDVLFHLSFQLILTIVPLRSVLC